MEIVVSTMSVRKDHRILITGHMGLKDSWLCQRLLADGAEVAGFAKAPKSTLALFNVLGLASHSHHVVGEIRDGVAIRPCMWNFRPEVVLYLAAQPLLRRSYREPAVTWSTNLQGTLNMVDAVLDCPVVRACVVVTSDKCHENQKSMRGYQENNSMGGHDPYSSPNEAAELAVASWRRSSPDMAPLATARAGNIIGGGDWNEDRIDTDFVAAILAGTTLESRIPSAIRPWQRVLEPLSGYLIQAQRLMEPSGPLYAEGWNFGPALEAGVTVEALTCELVDAWDTGQVEVAQVKPAVYKASTLRLDCSKDATRLGWKARWTKRETVRRTAQWFREFARDGSAKDLCQADLIAYPAASVGLVSL